MTDDQSNPPESERPDEQVSTEAAADAVPAADIEDDPPKNLFVRYVLNRHLSYPNAYTWLLLMSALDIMLTWVVLWRGGIEVNPIADWVLDKWALTGIILYKFILILIFILICEIVGSLRENTGRLLSRFSVVLASFPVVWSMVLLWRNMRG